MELYFKVVGLVIFLILYEIAIKRSNLTFNKWVIFIIFTIFSYATISSSYYSDITLERLFYYILIVSTKAISLSILYIVTRQSYLTLSEKSKKHLYYECGALIILLMVFFYILIPKSHFDIDTEQIVQKMSRDAIGTSIEGSLIILGIYIFIRNWIYMKIAAKKNV